MDLANLPISFYGDVLLTTAYILNLVHSKFVPSTPYELRIKTKPKLKHFHPWDSTGYVHSTSHTYGKLGRIGKKKIFIRYPKLSKGYVIFG